MTESPIFVDTFTLTHDNPLLQGHVIRGRSLMPAVGHLDLVLHVLGRHGHAVQDVELRDFTILAPLAVQPGEQVLTTVEGRPSPTGGLRIEVRGRHGQDAPDVTYAVVTAHPGAVPAFEERLPLPLDGTVRTTPLADIYTWCREHELVHSGLMKTDGVFHRRPSDWVAEVELAPEHHGSADAFLFQPALFEAGLLCGGVAFGLLHDGADNPDPRLPQRFGLYLPLVFESFRATAPLGRRCFIRIPAESVRGDDELVRLTMEFYDPNGLKVAEVAQYVAKRVRDTTASESREEAVVAPAPVAVWTGGSSAAGSQDVVAVLCELIGARLGRAPGRIRTGTGYYELGLASADLLSLKADLEDRLSLPLSPTIMFEYPTVTELAAFLEGLLAERQIPAAPASTSDPESAVCDTLTGEVSALLGVPAGDVHPDDTFEELGLDWVGLARLADRVNDRFGLTLMSAAFGEHRTVRAMAAYLASARREPVEAGQVPPQEPEPAGPVPTRPHPMLQRAVRHDDGHAYETRFDGSEPYLRDHQVRGSRVLPGAAQLEMARAAVERALGGRSTGQVRLDDVMWLRPAVCGPDGLVLRVSVRTATTGGWEYDIHSVDGGGGHTLCSQGRASLRETGDLGLPSLEELREACGGGAFSVEHIYGLYADAGLDYGPAQRSLVRLGVGTDEAGQPQVLAELRLPVAAEPLDGFRLHPSIIDGALQATIGLRLTDAASPGRPGGPALPFALQHVDAPDATPARAYAWIRPQRGSSPVAASAKLDITVFDERGEVCVNLTGLSTRTLPDLPPTAQETTVERSAPHVPGRADGDIAIVGLSGRYPEAADLDEFWDNLRSGRDCVREVPTERWDHRRYTDGSDTGRTPGRWGGFLDGIDLFDPLFFQISMLEAEHLDPQERLFLQTAHHVLEDAGYTGERLARPGRVGVFVGAMYQEFQLHGAQAQERGRLVALSGSASTIANRVSYFYNFTGPSMTVDTMCSGSLTAIHLACEAIKSGQCHAAIAGGVNLTSHPNKYLLLGLRNFLSSDGRCRSFGAGGDGYVPGEGVGAVLLKPLERAVADGDHIYGVIKGTAVNHGGRSPGYSVPSPAAQGEVIADALRAARVDPRALSYIEAHGTGTSLGDPIEVAGLIKGLSSAGSLPENCAIGSVKSNIGHSESAAGMAGITKVLLQMRHGELVPTLHCETLNPHIDFDRIPLRVQRQLEPWRRPMLEVDGERRTVPRIAGVSSFGAGGSNAHIVISEYEPALPSPVRAPADGRPALLLLSARSEEQLVDQARRLHARLAELSDTELPDVAWTLQTGRTALEERLAFAATSVADTRARLESFAADPRRPGAWARGAVQPDREATAGRRTDDELASALVEWSARGTHDRLLGLWAVGAEVDWETLHRAGPPARQVSLPGYPFARERCWPDLGPGVASHESLVPPAAHVPQPQPQPLRPAEGAAEPDEVLLLRPVWTAQDARPGDAAPAERFAEHHVVVVGRLAPGEREALRTGLPANAVCRFVELPDGPLDHQYTEVTRQVFTLVRDLLAAGVRRPALLQTVLTGDPATDVERERLACFGGLAGLLRTAGLENPLLHTRYLECLDGASPATIAARIAAEATGVPEPEVRHRDGLRYVARLAEMPSAMPADQPWKQGGVYLITGGVGGLGLIMAREIAASAGQATVVLTGRSTLNPAQAAALEALRVLGLTVDHQRADVADRAAVTRLLDHVRRTHGPLTGILHSAGVTDDKLIVRKTVQELERVLAPKVAGLVHLDELSRDQPLETFLCFSSTSGAFGNPGQADYAAANAFMDAYAAYRNRLVDAGLRSGAMVSVDWPLWDEGGMGTDGALRERLRGTGVVPLDTVRGVRALHCAQAAEENDLSDGRLVVLAGRRDALLPWLTGLADTPAAPRPIGEPGADAASVPGTAQSPVAADRGLEDRAVGHLRHRLAAALNLGPERLGPDTPLERYGMDSVIAVGVTAELEDAFGPLSRTLLFEVQTVRELARYFVTEHAPALRALLGEPTAPQQAPPSGVHDDDGPARPGPVEAPVSERPRPDSGGGAAASRRAQSRDRDPGTTPPGRSEEIAIIGVSGRYPQADDLDTLWSNLRSGKDCVTEIPADRWERLYGAEPAEDGASRGMWGAFLAGIDRFDPLHFGISPREAEAMDPQQRLFLETVWHLLEESGVTQDVIERRYGRRVGVYVGAAYQMYRADESDPVLAALTSAASYNLIANRVSHFFGLEGPSLALDNMCASSATAVHLACADLLRGESELAIAGGVNLTVHPEKYLALSEMRLLGSHPGSRSFRDGDGYLPAEAVGAVLLKPLSAAVRDGDTVHAVIKGTASLHGGRANGFMTPSHRAQVRVMRRAMEQAGVEPGSIGYVEAAANGTTLSDEVEVRALREVFGSVAEPVAVGTVKSNLGHPEPASGIAQLTKVVLQLRHEELAPLVDAGSPNPNLDLDGTALRLCERLTAWEPRATVGADGLPTPRRALINSVAAGGSHVSLVIEAPPVTDPVVRNAEDTGSSLVVLSAGDSERLLTAARQLRDFLERDDRAGLADLAYTTQVGRDALPERLAVVAGSREELAQALTHYLQVHGPDSGCGTDHGSGVVVPVHLGNAETDAGVMDAVLSGARGEEFLATLVDDRDLERLAELWVRGARVPWGGLHNGHRRLVRLPATAFDRGNYWIGRRARSTVAAEPGASSGRATPAVGRRPAPRLTDSERTMVAVWAELLGVDAGKLDETSSFLSLGGNSLLATRLINLLRQYTGVELTVQAVFDAPRLGELAAVLDRRAPEAGGTGTGEVETILESIGFIEGLTDEELNSLAGENSKFH
ncbi:SDR family NAD(P)-dependent oxidoreductase [Streptomyces sp. SID12501]|uniref:SDR family NAD(P)-dependent oxidoreductase n=1 Tax=Streptomyces sp. SID12501 TaxID=2706042 RepID=A0A6B3C325_9ACTN|nr:SDR family NAD(P)-dependent oxidoreductase [Streptomyces sp. SID12501]NEC91059.1 SDR family NAD(P)-dependent oxidoreductase [Streptomyces sp. SID12501]